ncbi:hypothetical protein EUX98_g978 [Antrodiella citrinella]|uniref:Peptidase M48 domain-containing protein n=1 Tax=Antrodiella citrinella TaxID=2447956 RepID=A0A4S4NB92_9APHY|nr:hypothetical protein EUX98_g978 [Antrodiella citrinella]
MYHVAYTCATLNSTAFREQATYHAILAAVSSSPACTIRTSLVYRSLLPAFYVGTSRSFHTTPRNDALPFLPVLAGILKTSSAMEVARTVVRVTFTLIPFILIKNHKLRRGLAIAEASGYGDSDRKSFMLRKIRYGTILFHLLLFTPVVLFWLTILASVERTPLTGRWRLILLSPEEEEEISLQLAGPGWYKAVGDILAKDGSRNIVAPTDWRVQWVRDTLQRLEGAIPSLQHEQDLGSRWLECGPDDIPFPPPADHPLRPRPRASEYIRRLAEVSCSRTPHRSPHVIPGPPYSLIVVDKPESSNAFSYGFGPDGGGGVVVFSGFLNDVLSKGGASQTDEMDFSQTMSPAQSEPTSWWSAIFGGIFPLSAAVSAAPPHPIPTEAQTSELAILLAHELAHLILSHHLETLSSTSVVWPGVVSIVTDVVRAILFPVTMMFGPFLNDAVASVGKTASWDLQEMAEFCTSQSQEIEADVVSARLLAHAGFDPRHALQFWEQRGDTEETAECTPTTAKTNASGVQMRWSGSAHPLNEVRVAKLREEFERWEKERAKARERLNLS